MSLSAPSPFGRGAKAGSPGVRSAAARSYLVVVILCSLAPYAGAIEGYTVSALLIAVLACSGIALVGRISLSRIGSGLAYGALMALSALISFSVWNRPVEVSSFSDFMFLALWMIVPLALDSTASKLGADSYLKTLAVAALVAAAANLIVILFGFYSEESWVDLFGETARFDSSYAKVRAFGAIGQPGKLGMWGGLTCVLGGVLRRIPALRSYALGLTVLGLVSAAASFSRVGIILAALATLGLWGRYGALMVVMCAFAGMVFRGDEAGVLLLRSDGAVDFSSLDNRLVLRQVAYETISEEPVRFLLGFGPSKEAADQVTVPMVDHSLRHPDSSFTVVLFRYGLLGVLAAGILVETVVGWRRTLRTAAVRREAITFLIITGLGVSLDPLFHDAKVLILYLLAAQSIQVVGGLVPGVAAPRRQAGPVLGRRAALQPDVGPHGVVRPGINRGSVK